jgi:hypothetical protein
MLLQKIADLLKCEVLAPIDRVVEIDTVVASDGMSEILAFYRPHALMLTGLTNIQSVRTAMVADVHAIVFVRGKRPRAEVLELAVENHLPVLVTELGMFDSCGILYEAGLEGVM